MTERRRFRLTDLDLDRVDIVDVPANQGAEIVIAKGMPDVDDVHVESTKQGREGRKPGKGKYRRPRTPAEGALRGDSRLFDLPAEDEMDKDEEGRLSGGNGDPDKDYRQRKQRMAKRIAEIAKHGSHDQSDHGNREGAAAAAGVAAVRYDNQSILGMGHPGESKEKINEKWRQEYAIRNARRSIHNFDTELSRELSDLAGRDELDDDLKGFYSQGVEQLSSSLGLHEDTIHEALAQNARYGFLSKAGAMTPPDNTKKPPAPVAQPTPAAPKPPATGGPGVPPQPMAPGGGLNQKPASPAPLGGGAMNPAAPGAPMAPGAAPGMAPGLPGGPMGAEFGAKPGMPRLQRLTPDMFEMTADSQTHKEWSLKPEALPDNMEAVVVSMMSDGDGARYQWMMDPLDGPPRTGQSRTAPEAMMALRDALTSYVATSAMQFMGGAAPLGMPGAPGMPGAGMPGAGAPGAPMPGGPQRPPAAPGAPAPPAAGGSEGSKPAAGGGLLERLRASMGNKAPAGPAAGESRPKPAGGANPAARPPAKPEEKLRKALDLIARDFAEMDIVKAGTDGGDLRDILSSRTLESLSSMVSATKSADVEGASMPIDIDALAAQLPDEVLDYIEGLEGEVERLSEVTKSLSPATLPQDAIAKALDSLPPDVAAIVKADRERTERLEKALVEERIAKANSEWIAKTSTLNVVEDAQTLGTKLRALAEFDSDLADDVFKALDLASRQVAAGNLFSEFGKSGGATGVGAESKIEAIAKGYQEADPTVSIEVARAMAYENHPQIYAEYLAERQGR